MTKETINGGQLLVNFFAYSKTDTIERKDLFNKLFKIYDRLRTENPSKFIFDVNFIFPYKDQAYSDDIDSELQNLVSNELIEISPGSIMYGVSEDNKQFFSEKAYLWIFIS